MLYIILLLSVFIIILIAMVLKKSKLITNEQELRTKLEKNIEVKQLKISYEKKELEKFEKTLQVRETYVEEKTNCLEKSIEKFELNSNATRTRLDDREQAVELLSKKVQKKTENLDEDRLVLSKEMANFQAEKIVTIEKVAKSTQEDAKKMLIDTFMDDLNLLKMKELDQFSKKLELEKEEKARAILLQAIDSVDTDYVNEEVTKHIIIPNESMKGRLIGREGRNIKSLENTLGITVIIDDTPGQISISTFDTVRRAIAYDALTNLITSGNINQVQIEKEAVASQKRIDSIILEKGKETLYQLNIQEMDIELVKIIGQLYFRSSMRQNVLQHSIETAKICMRIASELNLDPNMAIRCGLLHDIGKVDSQKTGRSHVDIGIQYANTFKEHPNVVNSIASHHGDHPADNPYSVIVAIADSISASRPGVRFDTYDAFITRIESLESIALDEKGVHKAYALQGGRELRMIVNSDTTLESEMDLIAFNIKKRIEKELMFPGIIKINVLREKRSYVEASKENIINRSKDV